VCRGSAVSQTGDQQDTLAWHTFLKFCACPRRGDRLRCPHTPTVREIYLVLGVCVVPIGALQDRWNIAWARLLSARLLAPI